MGERYYFDLSQGDIESEFKRLVRHLYGEKTYPVPPLGNKPDWVDQPEIIPDTFYSPLSKLDYEKNPKERKRIAKAVLDDLTSKIMAINVPNVWDERRETQDVKPFMAAIEETKQYKDGYVDLAEKIVSDDFFEDIFVDFAGKYYDKNNETISVHAVAVKKLVLHEIAIYTIAILWQNDEYAKIKSILQCTYFTSNGDAQTFDDLFCFYDTTRYIHVAKNKLDNKKYYDAQARILIERLNSKYPLDLFVFADILIFNLGILHSEKKWCWFPFTYPYEGYGSCTKFNRFAREFISRKKLTIIGNYLVKRNSINTMRILHQLNHFSKRLQNLKKTMQVNLGTQDCSEMLRLFLIL